MDPRLIGCIVCFLHKCAAFDDISEPTPAEGSDSATKVWVPVVMVLVVLAAAAVAVAITCIVRRKRHAEEKRRANEEPGLPMLATCKELPPEMSTVKGTDYMDSCAIQTEGTEEQWHDPRDIALMPRREELSQPVVIVNERETADAEHHFVARQTEVNKLGIAGVVDPRSDHVISLAEAEREGIVDKRTGNYVNPVTKETRPILSAIEAGLIKAESISTQKTTERRRDIGLMVIMTEKESRSYTIRGAIDAKTDRELTVEEAVAEGILDLKQSVYNNTAEHRDMSLADAIDSGLLLVDYAKDAILAEPEVVTKTYAIHNVMDTQNEKRVSFNEAIREGLLDPDTGSFHDSRTGEDIRFQDAIHCGLIKATVNDPQSMNIRQQNIFVLDSFRAVKDKVLRPLSALKQAAGLEESRATSDT